MSPAQATIAPLTLLRFSSDIALPVAYPFAIPPRPIFVSSFRNFIVLSLLSSLTFLYEISGRSFWIILSSGGVKFSFEKSHSLPVEANVISNAPWVISEISIDRLMSSNTLSAGFTGRRAEVLFIIDISDLGLYRLKAVWTSSISLNAALKSPAVFSGLSTIVMVTIVPRRVLLNCECLSPHDIIADKTINTEIWSRTGFFIEHLNTECTDFREIFVKIEIADSCQDEYDIGQNQFT